MDGYKRQSANLRDYICTWRILVAHGLMLCGRASVYRKWAYKLIVKVIAGKAGQATLKSNSTLNHIQCLCENRD